MNALVFLYKRVLQLSVSNIEINVLDYQVFRQGLHSMVAAHARAWR